MGINKKHTDKSLPATEGFFSSILFNETCYARDLLLASLVIGRQGGGLYIIVWSFIVNLK